MYSQYEYFCLKSSFEPIQYLPLVQSIRNMKDNVDLSYNITGFHISYFTRPPLDLECVELRYRYIQKTAKKIAAHFSYEKLAIIARTLHFSWSDLKQMNACEVEAWLNVIQQLTDREHNQQKSFLQSVTKELSAPAESKPAVINKPNFLM